MPLKCYPAKFPFLEKIYPGNVCFYRKNISHWIFSFLQLIKSDATLASIMPTEACDIFIFLKSRNILETFKM